MSKFSNLSTDRIVRFFTEFNEGTVLFIVVQTDFSRFFREKYIVRRVMEARESWTPCFSCRSLLLSTTIRNDYSY